MRRSIAVFAVIISLSILSCALSWAQLVDRDQQRKEEMERLQKRFDWWPTDAQPAPVKDTARGGYWWMPKSPGATRPWGNRGYIYVYKVIFDYKEEELPPPMKDEMRPSLLIRKIIKNVKVYFDFDKTDLRDDTVKILKSAVAILKKNKDASILITGNCDIRGSENYNEKLGKRRGESVQQYMLDHGITEDRIRIVSRGKLDAIAPVSDLEGMAKDRNAQFMVAEVDEIMVKYPGDDMIAKAQQIEEGKYVVEESQTVEGKVRVSTREYVIQPGDTLSGIAKSQLGSGSRWKYIYELNKDRIKNPNKLRAGKVIFIPVE